MQSQSSSSNFITIPNTNINVNNNFNNQSQKQINQQINNQTNSNQNLNQFEQSQQKAYTLPHKVSCTKHPSKSIQYFCKHPQCMERLFCSACLLKKQYCRHDISTYVIDIAQFVYQQKMTYQMKGLSKEQDIYDYLINKQSRRNMYYQIVDKQIQKFDQQLTNLLNSITKTITQLKQNIKQQLQQFKTSYLKTQQIMLKKVQQAFSMSYLAQFQSFQQAINSKDITNLIGLKNLLQKFTFQAGDQSKNKQIRKYFQNLISMHDQTPQIDYQRFQSIKSYYTVFQTKLSQAGPLLIALHKSTSNSILNQKDQNPNALIDPLVNLPIQGIKKIAKSASFPSNHARTIYVSCRLPDRKLITGSDDGALNIFDMTTFQNIGSYQCHVSGIRSMILLPNGRLVTGSYDKSIKIWPDPTKIIDLSQSKLQLSQISNSSVSKKGNPLNPLKMLTGHTSCIISLKYLNDGATFASGSADYTIKVWDYERGQNIKNFSGHMSDVLCLQCTSTGHTLISGSSDRTVKVWSLTKKYSSACLKTMTGHLDFIWTICLLQDNTTLFSGGLDKTIKMWDITTGNLIRNLPNQHISHITKIIQYTKQVIVSCANDGTIKFWDWKGNNSIHSLQLEAGISTMLIMNEQGIIAAGQDKNLYLCD